MGPKRKISDEVTTTEPSKSKSSKTSAKSASKSINIEYCKSWNAFKTRALKLSDLLTKNGYTVECNTEKPRKGCFVVKCGDEIVVELLNMPRPFAKLKALDIEELAQSILKA